MNRTAPLLLCLLAGCAGVEGEIRTLRVRDTLRRFFLGSDRGADHYIWTIGSSVTMPQGTERYAYRGRAHVAHYNVVRSLRGLGATEPRTTTELTNIVDPLLFVLVHDPIGAVRATACVELGRIVGGLPDSADSVCTSGAKAAAAVHLIAGRLARCQRRIEQGETVEEAEIIESLRRLAGLEPPDLLSARQLVRAVGSRPIAGSAGRVRQEADRLVPGIVRRCVLAALAVVATGALVQPGAAPDPSAIARGDALLVLERVGNPIGRSGALRRLVPSIDPPEADPDVRRALLRYLGLSPDPEVFSVCVQCLDDVDSGVRFCAQETLQRMTRARVAPTSDAWLTWAEGHPGWWQPEGPPEPRSTTPISGS